MNNLDKQGILDKFYIEYHNDNYDKAIEYLKHIIQLEKKGSFWLYSRLSSCHYELKEYGESIKYGNLAYRLKPNSPVVLWDYAGVLIMLNKEKKAIKLLLRIQSMEDDLTIYGFPTPNRRVMQSMKNDCNYQLGVAYYRLNEDQLAINYFLKYLSQRKKGLKTIYQKNKALNYLKKLA